MKTLLIVAFVATLAACTASEPTHPLLNRWSTGGYR